MRRVLFLSTLALAGLPVAAHAQLPPVPEAPLTTPTLPVPLSPLPSLPAPPPVAAPPPPAAPSAPSLPASGPAPAPSSTTGPRGATAPASSSPGGSRATAPDGSGQGRRARRRATVTFTFRAPAAERIVIPLTQVAPVCRDAGRLLFAAERGVNRFRFDGRAGRTPLRDGTYLAQTPAGRVRFAIVRGRPTRDPEELAPGVCAVLELGALGLRSSAAPAGPGPASRSPRPATGGDASVEGVVPLPRVLGTTLTEAAEAAASLHPAFYVLLALAITALGAATLPARSLPFASAGAVLSRRRAELTLGGTLALLSVIVAYWVTLP